MSLLSIRRQMLLLTLLPLMLLVAGGGGMFIHWHFSNLDQQLEDRARLIAHQLASSSEFGVFSGDISYLQQIAQSALQQPDVRGVAILDANGRVLLSSGAFADTHGKAVLAHRIYDDVSAFKPIMRNEKGLWLYKSILAEQVALGEFDVSRPMVQQLGSVVVEMHLEGIRRMKSSVLKGAVAFGLLFGILAIGLLQFAGRKIATPICRLSDAVQEIGQGRLGTRLILDTRIRELDSLTTGLNEMAVQLQKEREGLERKVAQATEALQAKLLETEQLARTDPLTGIRNRRDVLEAGGRELQLARRSGLPLTVAALDVDLFKQVNDTYGHAEGDQVLCAIAACVNGMIRSTDLFGRTGGEEFILFLPNTVTEEGMQLAERVREEVAHSVEIADSGRYATISMGLSTYHAGPARLDDLLAAADQALYRAKAQGRNCISLCELQNIAGTDKLCPAPLAETE